MNQLLIKIKNSFDNILYFVFSIGACLKKINIDENTIRIKKVRINNPLDGSFAKVCTEFKIPDLTRKVPVTLIVKVRMLKTITQE